MAEQKWWHLSTCETNLDRYLYYFCECDHDTYCVDVLTDGEYTITRDWCLGSNDSSYKGKRIPNTTIYSVNDEYGQSLIDQFNTLKEAKQCLRELKGE